VGRGWREHACEGKLATELDGMAWRFFGPCEGRKEDG
jgi:hypothetical protein